MKYKTKNGQDYTIPGVGRTENGQIETDQPLEGPNFIPVEDQIPQVTQPVAPAPVPAASPSITATSEKEN